MLLCCSSDAVTNGILTLRVPPECWTLGKCSFLSPKDILPAKRGVAWPTWHTFYMQHDKSGLVEILGIFFLTTDSSLSITSLLCVPFPLISLPKILGHICIQFPKPYASSDKVQHASVPGGWLSDSRCHWGAKTSVCLSEMLEPAEPDRAVAIYNLLILGLRCRFHRLFPCRGQGAALWGETSSGRGGTVAQTMCRNPRAALPAALLLAGRGTSPAGQNFLLCPESAGTKHLIEHVHYC